MRETIILLKKTELLGSNPRISFSIRKGWGDDTHSQPLNFFPQFPLVFWSRWSRVDFWKVIFVWDVGFRLVPVVDYRHDATPSETLEVRIDQRIPLFITKSIYKEKWGNGKRGIETQTTSTWATLSLPLLISDRRMTLLLEFPSGRSSDHSFPIEPEKPRGP